MLRSIELADISLNVRVEGAGEPLVFVHGFPLDHTMWNGQIEYFAPERLVIAPDQRGFGGSGVTAGVASMELLADDLAQLLDRLGIPDPVDLCGLSMGGCVGWQFALRHGQRLRRLIQCDSRAAADSEQMRDARLANAERVLAEGQEFLIAQMQPRLFGRHTLDHRADLVEATAAVIRRNTREGIAAACRGLALRPDVTSQVAQLRLPMVFVCGAEDVISPPAEMRGVAGTIPGAEFVEIPAAGHMAPLEQPDAVNRAIAAFLSRATPPASP